MSRSKRLQVASETLCALQMNRILARRGLTAHHQGPQARYDLSICDPGGNEVAVAEITRDCDRQNEQYSEVMVSLGNKFPSALPNAGTWLVSISRPINVKKRLEPVALEIIRSMVQRGLAEVRADSNSWPPTDLEDRAERAGISSLRCIGEVPDAIYFIGPSRGSSIDESPELPATYVARAIRRDSVLTRANRLATAAASAQLVIIPDHPEELSMTFRMNEWNTWPGHPNSDPQIPKHLDAVWLVNPALGSVITWSRDRGWERAAAEGSGWWRRHSELPALRILVEEPQA